TRTCNDLLEASVPAQYKKASTALAVDWTDVESFARPPRHGTTACADPEASWGHRNSNLPGPKGEMFFGYYLFAGTMMREERGPRGTHDGAIIANGSLYCPATPKPLLQLGPLPPGATREQATAHDTRAAELAKHKLGRISADDADGYHRVMCPAVMGKIRCPLRPQSMTLTRHRPEILTPPENPPACCTQQTLTVPPQVAAKTRQK